MFEINLNDAIRTYFYSMIPYFTQKLPLSEKLLDRNYWKTHNFIQISDNLLNEIVKYSIKFPTQQCEIFMADFGGALNNINRDAKAWYHRDLKYVMNVHCRWKNASNDNHCIA